MSAAINKTQPPYCPAVKLESMCTSDKALGQTCFAAQRGEARDWEGEANKCPAAAAAAAPPAMGKQQSWRYETNKAGPD